MAEKNINLKLKICIVTPSFAGGGAERIAVNLANQYFSCNHSVSVVAFNMDGPFRNDLSPNIDVINLGVSRTRQTFFKIKLLRKIIENIKPDLIISVLRDSSIFLGIACYFNKDIKLMYLEANTMDKVQKMFFPKQFFYKFLMRLSYKKAYAVVANSYGTQQDLLKNKIITKNKITVIGNPVLSNDFEILASEMLNHPWFSDKSLKTILNVGRLTVQKNHKMLIDSFAEVLKHIPVARLIILGTGEEKDNLKEHTKNLGVEEYIEFVDFQPNPYPWYKNSDLFVLTSIFEGFGNVLVEAMACGTPVISTDCPGGPKEILDNGKYGDLVPVNNIYVLTESIVKHFSQERDENKIALASERALEYSIEKISIKYLELMFK